jgi:glucose-1-phosphate adenylyltransferase
MDLLNPKVPLDLYDPQWRIYSRNEVLPPHYCGDNCTIENSMISEGCNIDGRVDASILFGGVTIEKGAVVHDSIIMPNAHIKAGAAVQYAIVGEDTVIGENVRIGQRPETMDNLDDWGVAVIGHQVCVADNTVVKPKAMISESI